MAESTLAMPLSELQNSVAFDLGYCNASGSMLTDCDDDQIAAVTRVVRAGVRQYLKTPPVPGIDPGGYDWSFLHPVGTLTLASGESEVELPDDFGGFQSHRISVSVGSTAGLVPAEITGLGRILEARAFNSELTGRPTMFAIEPVKTTSLTEGQRFELQVYPTADQAYTLTFEYFFLPNVMDGTHPYIVGGATHSGTLEASCLAKAEIMLDGVNDGPQYMNFLRELAGSIAADRRMKPSDLGYNDDRSDTRHRGRRRELSLGTFSIGGVLCG